MSTEEEDKIMKLCRDSLTYHGDIILNTKFSIYLHEHIKELFFRHLVLKYKGVTECFWDFLLFISSPLIFLIPV